MPAYFNISVQILRSDIYGSIIGDFYAALGNSGMKFISGFLGCENNSLDDIIGWNQAKLEQDFRLGLTENHINDFRQVLFVFGDFSPVRVFIMNNYPEQETFSFELLIPEAEVIGCEYPLKFRADRISPLIKAAKLIWQLPFVRTIQTGTEADSASVGITALKSGKCGPHISPFAITEELFGFDRSGITSEELSGRRGYLFTRGIRELF